MKTTTDWDPALYLKFDRERTRPSLDLISRIEVDSPTRILDLGCGPGNAVPGLSARWPDGQITGIDTSPAMVDRARQAHPGHTWAVGDARQIAPGDRYDLIFSNAVIQWIPDHATLLPLLLKSLTPQGALAVQVPNYGAMPVSALVDRVFSDLAPPDNRLSYHRIFTVHEPGFYHSLLGPLARRFDLWETTYFHPLPSARAVVEMLTSTGLRPYLEVLKAEADRQDFLDRIESGVAEIHPGPADGTVLFPFRRLFFVAYL